MRQISMTNIYDLVSHFQCKKKLISLNCSPAGQGLRVDLQQPTKQQERYTQAHLQQCRRFFVIYIQFRWLYFMALQVWKQILISYLFGFTQDNSSKIIFLKAPTVHQQLHLHKSIKPSEQQHRSTTCALKQVITLALSAPAWFYGQFLVLVTLKHLWVIMSRDVK